jgi:hypothetical protein
MVTTCYIYVHAETNTHLHSTSSNCNSLDRNSSMRSIGRELEIVANLQDDVSC